jgi:hypothetical protein
MQFYVGDPMFWRSNILFDLSAQQIASIVLLDHEQPSASFHLQRMGEGTMKIARGPVPKEWSHPDQEMLSQYLAYYRDVRFESYFDPRSDTLHYAEEPSMELAVVTVEGQQIRLELFPAWQKRASGQVEPDFNVLYAWLEPEQEMLVVKYVQIDLLLKDYEYFQALKK